MRKLSIFPIIGIAAALAALLVIGCSAESASDKAGYAENFGPAGDGMDAGLPMGGRTAFEPPGAEGAATGSMDPSILLNGDAPVLPPEEEKLIDFEQPQAGKRFVFVANPETHKVFIIDAQNYSVKSKSPGERPTYLKSVTTSTDEADTVIVLNIPSSSSKDKNNAAIIRARANQDPTVASLEVVKNSNVIAVSPDGMHAVIYYNSDYSSASESSGSYQDVTVISLSEGNDRSKKITVGFRPKAVHFSKDGSRGFVVTEDGVSILDFADIEQPGAGIAETVSLGYTLNEIPSDVSVTADGRYALARLQNNPVVHLVDLETKTIKALNLVLGEIVTPDSEDDGEDAGVDPQGSQGQVTDLDLASSGEFAVAVLRDTSTVLKIPVPQAFENPSLIKTTEIEGAIIGLSELAPDESYALLYTTAVYDERITIVYLDKEDDPRTVQLRKSISSVAVAPDSKSALIVHNKADGSRDEPGINENTRIDRSWGYSILKLADAFAKLQVTETKLGPFVITPDHLFVLFRDDALMVNEVHRASLVGLQIDVIGLERPPYSIGSIPQSKKVFIAQEQSGGLITLMDWEGDAREDISGFDRNEEIDYLGNDLGAQNE
jgi:hypothetical protein